MKGGEQEVNRLTIMVMGLFIFGCLTGATSYAAQPISKTGDKAYEVSEMIGTNVKNPQGESLGTVRDILIDSQGRASLAVLSYWDLKGMKEKLVAVPFYALSFNPAAKDFTLNVRREKLESAPAFDRKDLANAKRAEDIFRYFGQQPSWTEEGEMPGAFGHPMREKTPGHISTDYDEMG